MNEPAARELISRARDAKSQLARNLLMAAAFREIVETEPIVVGGTAEEFWTRDEYRPTDLDLCAPMTKADASRLRSLGFKREGRHWFHGDVPTVAIELPNETIDGTIARAHLEPVAGGAARIIGLDDLYLDRLRQATASPVDTSREYMSALAVMAARYEDLDRDYIEQRLKQIAIHEHGLVREMRRIDKLLDRRIRKMLSES